MTGLSTLCYIEQDGKYLMLHRTVKKHDVNKEKWIGVGGHFEAEESPEECLLREVKEETGYTLTGDGVTEYMSLFTADGFEGTPIPCDEGELAWVAVEEVWKLNIWEGDKIFFRLIDENRPFFSLKLVYDGRGRLVSAALDGKPMELFDILNPDGSKSGLVRERGVAHREGSLHAASHIWVARRSAPGRFELLLQKRSSRKDSYPGCFDISAAGHVSSGEEYLGTALRELKEELGIRAEKDQLLFAGMQRSSFRDIFYGRPFHNEELSAVYLYLEPVDASALSLQESEVESVRWMDLCDCICGVQSGSFPNCIDMEELQMIEHFLQEHFVS